MKAKRLRLIALIVLALTAGGLLSSCFFSKTPPRTIRVGVVIQSNGEISTHCVTLAEGATGYDALMKTGLPVEASISAQGVAVCRIGDIGCPADDCFCQCQGPQCTYWAYFHLREGEWVLSSVGAGAHPLQEGDVEGWRWGKGEPPLPQHFSQICALGE